MSTQRDSIGGDSVGDNKISVAVTNLSGDVSELRQEMIAAIGVIERLIADTRQEQRAAFVALKNEHRRMVALLARDALEGHAQTRTMAHEAVKSLGMWYADLRDEVRAVSKRLDGLVAHIYRDRD